MTFDNDMMGINADLSTKARRWIWREITSIHDPRNERACHKWTILFSHSLPPGQLSLCDTVGASTDTDDKASNGAYLGQIGGRNFEKSFVVAAPGTYERGLDVSKLKQHYKTWSGSVNLII